MGLRSVRRIPTLGLPWSSREVKLDAKGEAAFDAPAPGRVWFPSQSLLGYGFQGGDTEIRPGEGPQVIEAIAEPAGAIVGQVLDADGRPAVADVSLSCRNVEASAGQVHGTFRREKPAR